MMFALKGVSPFPSIMEYKETKLQSIDSIMRRFQKCSDNGRPQDIAELQKHQNTIQAVQKAVLKAEYGEQDEKKISKVSVQ